MESTHRFIKKILQNKQILKHGREHSLRRAQMDSIAPDGGQPSTSEAGTSGTVSSLPASVPLPAEGTSEESESDFDLEDLISHRF